MMRTRAERFWRKAIQCVALGCALWASSMSLACASRAPFVWYSQLPELQRSAPRSVIAAGDTILVQVDGHADLSGEFAVGASGAFAQPLAGPIQVAGLQTEQAAAAIRDRLNTFIEAPRVSVVLLAYKPLQVPVVGEVQRPGVVEVAPTSGVLVALGAAGGLSELADKDAIYVVRSVGAQRIRFRYRDLLKPEPAAVAFELREGDTVLVE